MARSFPHLIALHAADCGGKDTAGGLIQEICQPPETWVPFASRGFADKVKQSIAASWGIDPEYGIEFGDKLKQEGVRVTIEGSGWSVSATGRNFIRDFATKGHRELMDPDFWVDLLLPVGAKSWHANFDHAAFCVITDLRFNSEAERIRFHGGEVWSIVGRGEPFDKDHLSNGDFEWQDADFILDNSGDLENLRRQIETLL